ncbi:tRNA (adenosine(37)-N6)-threonylcarbamoyltransferase complex ATPase subunit type 1 TsaE [Shimia sediminis]|uniref:tRNA (adenosine(37)-N6)-threonylcarbamoyltransferase complex ATPase subunit type 1 TsaE n=1 Tax=Shimia sediminis TaxID=2497945 RepID=UPI000F8DFA10|nr:tRNA (adenosine(37)-N6)-threonylcarbamoyltransferase complex ATPase subunit type 1 TsaE [Shimia sediminis]
MVANQLDLILSSSEETAALAQRLAPHLAAGDVLLLEGDIGAGKTHFVRSLIQSLLVVPEDVPSPTFTLVQVYEAAGFDIWHVDLYRLTSPDDVVELGLVEAFDDALCLVEWPDRLAELAPEEALTLRLTMTDQPGVRHLTLSATSSRWTALLSDLAND